MIPKVIHQMWVGPLPDQIAEYMATWPAVNPGWEVKVWGEDELEDFISITRKLWDRLDQVIIPSGILQAKSDLFRYEVLYREGGVYVDADFEARLPLDVLSLKWSGWTAWEIDDHWANMAISGFEAGHPFLQRCLQRLPVHMHRFTRRPARSSSPLCGPRFLTPILREFPEVVVMPSKLFYPYGFNELDRSGEDFPAAVAVHHWNHMRTVQK